MRDPEPMDYEIRTLVTYATRYGSTKEVAEYLTRILSENDFSVDLRPMQEVTTIEAYSNVVLGTPFYMGGWQKETDQFLERHQARLTSCRVAIFTLGPISANDDLNEAREQLDRELEKYPWLVPVAAEMFGGKYDPAKLSFSHRLLSALPASPLHGLPATDLRDWSSIRDWTVHLAENLYQQDHTET
jgi:menaquinone-dependent protoporphyrinogen oxidase